jgi:hypothetical protein
MNKYRSPERTIRDIINGQINGVEKPSLMSAIRKVAKKNTVEVEPEIKTEETPSTSSNVVSSNVHTRQNYAIRAQRKLKIIDNT